MQQGDDVRSSLTDRLDWPKEATKWPFAEAAWKKEQMSSSDRFPLRPTSENNTQFDFQQLEDDGIFPWRVRLWDQFVVKSLLEGGPRRGVPKVF